jgi:plasmid replication initiation protein
LGKLQVLKQDHVIQKSNILNEMRATNMTMQELRFLSIYLSKINKEDSEGTRLVRFELSEFQRIMELGRLNIKYLKNAINNLLCKVVNVPIEGRNGWDAFQLFKRCRVSQDDEGMWYVEVNAHDDALPLMFDFKKKYFNYQLWNALRLTSVNQLRIYELLKQYEKIGERVESLEDLRKWLGIAESEYPRWDSFRTRVLDACQKALATNTDIIFMYEPIRKGRGKGVGRKITHIKFIIQKNKKHVDQLSLEDYIDMQPKPDVIELDEFEMDAKYETEQLAWIASACDYAFDNAQIKVICNQIRHIRDDFERHAIIKTCYDKMNTYVGVKHPFQYFQKILQTEIEKAK